MTEVGQRWPDRTRPLTATTFLQYLPVLTACAYVATVLAMAPRLIRQLGWDSDAIGPFVLVERLRGHGAVSIPHNGMWTALWWLLATRHLPGHVQLWEATGYTFALASVALLGWATWQVGRRWAGATAAATAVIVGPVALRSFLTIVYHVRTPFTAALLGAYLVLLPRRRSKALAAGVGVLVGANAASDELIWLAAVVPFALASAILAVSSKRRDLAARASVVLAASAAAAVIVNTVMHRLGYHVVSADLGVAHLSDWPRDLVQLGRMVALLGGANYALPGGYPREPLRLLVALLAVAAIAATLLLAVRELRHRSEPTALAFAVYWAASAILVGVAFVLTTHAAANGAASVNYLLVLPLVAGAGVSLLAVDSPRSRAIVAVAIAVVGLTNIAGIVGGKAGIVNDKEGTSRGALETYVEPLTRFLEQQGVTKGYAGYWDANNLTWKSKSHLLMAPVSTCGSPNAPSICEFPFFVVASWFDEQPHSKSFLLFDPSDHEFLTKPPTIVKQASSARRFGPLTVYLFDHDLARDILPPET
ncbi:MAG TPA: hypothetical protein VEH52_04745 [Gaiellaceae bacterium]|nr:hypothetical protein [Gaiellaceae bacterium]